MYAKEAVYNGIELGRTMECYSGRDEGQKKGAVIIEEAPTMLMVDEEGGRYEDSSMVRSECEVRGVVQSEATERLLVSRAVTHPSRTKARWTGVGKFGASNEGVVRGSTKGGGVGIGEGWSCRAVGKDGWRGKWRGEEQSRRQREECAVRW